MKDKKLFWTIIGIVVVFLVLPVDKVYREILPAKTSDNIRVLVLTEKRVNKTIIGHVIDNWKNFDLPIDTIAVNMVSDFTINHTASELYDLNTKPKIITLFNKNKVVFTLKINNITFVDSFIKYSDKDTDNTDRIIN